MTRPNPVTIVVFATLCLLSGSGAWWIGKASARSEGPDEDPGWRANSKRQGPEYSHEEVWTIDPLDAELKVRGDTPLRQLQQRIQNEIGEPGGGDLDLLYAWLRELDPGEYEPMLEFARGLPSRDRYRIEQHVLSTWATRDPAAAASYGLKHVPSRHLTAALYGVMAKWAQADPEAAFAWYAERVEQGDYQPGFLGLRMLLTAITQHWARQDLNAVLTMAHDQLTDEERGFALSGPARLSHLESHRAQLLETLTALPEGWFRSEVIQRTASEWSMSAPADAARWIDEVGPSIEAGQRRMALSEIARRWQPLDPAATTKWLYHQTAESRPEAALHDSVRTWKEFEPAEAREWASAIPDPALKAEIMNLLETD